MPPFFQPTPDAVVSFDRTRFRFEYAAVRSRLYVAGHIAIERGTVFQTVERVRQFSDRSFGLVLCGFFIRR